jgi:hypothetical protein
MIRFPGIRNNSRQSIFVSQINAVRQCHIEAAAIMAGRKSVTSMWARQSSRIGVT